MADVDGYLAGLPRGAERGEMERLHELIGSLIPAAGQGTSYGMPCYTYRGIPVAAVILRRRHIAWYPFSGSVLPEVAGQLTGRSHTHGTLRFSAEDPLSDDLVRRLLDIRMRLIDEQLGNRA